MNSIGELWYLNPSRPSALTPRTPPSSQISSIPFVFCVLSPVRPQIHLVNPERRSRWIQVVLGVSGLLEYSKSLKMSAGIIYEESVSYVEEILMKPLSVKYEEIINDETLDFQENQKEPQNSALLHGNIQNNDHYSDMLVHSEFTNSVSCGSELPQTHTAHIGTKTFQCPEIEKWLSTNVSLGKHRVHIVEKMFACFGCGKCFDTKGNLTVHERIHTGEKPYACSECGNCFRTKGTLTIHERIHTGEKPYACSECGNCFRTKGTLTIHEKIHTGEKLFACSECENCFRTKCTLTIHERIHTGEKLFECSECEKCFISKGELKIHERIHTGEKPFACSECGKCFISQGKLTVHERIHIGEKPFACSKCEKYFRTKGELTKHERIHSSVHLH
uniref:C2H2-type domain-containing protein n=1 Tax=Leptobrachium leishanense TaxID=445787 RepID=A0A8C5MGF5_9ANUR